MKNKIHNSIDIETLDTKCTSEILSIGCTQFNIESGDIIAEFYLPVSCLGYVSFTTSEDTVKWWKGQTDAAKAAVFNRTDSIGIESALQQLSTFLNIGRDFEVWGNGSSFDITILEHAYNVCGLEVPWKFYDIRDMRTIVALAKSHDRHFNHKNIEREGTHHNALDDATHQAKVISYAFQSITYEDRF